MLKINTYLCFFLLIFSLGCSSKSEQTAEKMTFDQKALFENLASNLILPAYQDLAQKTNDLEVTTLAFIDTPDANKLEALKTQYMEAYLAWQKASFYEFGPASSENLSLSVNTYPTEKSKIEANIATNKEPENTTAKGFPALDYLLYGIGSNETEILEKYKSDPIAENRKLYLKYIINDLKKRINATLATWEGDYRQTFVSKEGNDAGSSLSLLVNGILLSYEADLKNAKFGIPAGVSVGLIKPNAQMVEGFYAQKSKALAQAKINAFIHLFMGGEGIGFDDYIQALKVKSSDGKPLSDEILERLNKAKSQIDDLPQKPLNQIIKDEKELVEAIYYSLQQAVIYMKSDMVSAFSIQITYQDGDGD